MFFIFVLIFIEQTPPAGGRSCGSRGGGDRLLAGLPILGHGLLQRFKFDTRRGLASVHVAKPLLGLKVVPLNRWYSSYIFCLPLNYDRLYHFSHK